MKRKRVVFIIHDLDFGGAQKFLITLVNSINVSKFEITIISLSNKNSLKEQLNDHIQLIELPRNSKFDFKHLFRLRDIINYFNTEYIFCIGFFSFFLVSLSTFFSKKYKKIISYHTTIQPTKKQDLLTKIYTSCLNKDDIIITVSKNQANYTSRRYKIKKVFFRTIYNGIDIKQWYKPESIQIKKVVREKLNIPITSKVIVIAAGLRPEKNHLNGIKALKILHEKYNMKAYLILVGDGEMRKNLEKVTKEYLLVDFIKFTGFQNNVRPYYWACDLFALCSNKVETFSIAALEAMACGLPAVITNIGGANEMIVENENGFLCTPSQNDIAQKWAKALDTKFEPSAISSNIHKSFNHEKMVLEYERILAS